MTNDGVKRHLTPSEARYMTAREAGYSAAWMAPRSWSGSKGF